MPALQEPAMEQTGRAQFRNIQRGARPGLSPVPGNRSGAMSNRPGGNSYVDRARGGALRDDYGQAGGEASALSALAPATQSLMAPQGQQIRQRSIEGARQQTVLHYDVRRQMAEDQDRAAALWNDQVTTLAGLALKGQMHRADQILKERGLDLEAQQLQQQGEYQKGQLDLGKEELGAKREDSAANRDLEREKLAQDKSLEQQKIRSEGNRAGAEIRERQEDRKIAREQLEVQREYNQGRVATAQQGNVERRRAAVLRAAENDPSIKEAFPEYFGDGSTTSGGAPGSTTVTQPPKPHPDAEWDEELGQWVMAG